jgi:hypothetical protein
VAGCCEHRNELSGSTEYTERTALKCVSNYVTSICRVVGHLERHRLSADCRPDFDYWKRQEFSFRRHIPVRLPLKEHWILKWPPAPSSGISTLYSLYTFMAQFLGTGMIYLIMEDF